MSDTKSIIKSTGVYLALCLVALFLFWLFLSVREYIKNKEVSDTKTTPSSKVVIVEAPEKVVLIPSSDTILNHEDIED